MLGLVLGATAGCGISLSLPDASFDAGDAWDGGGLSADWSQGEVLIGYENDGALREIAGRVGGQVVETIPEIRAARVALPPDMTVRDAVSNLVREHPRGLRYVEPNYRRRLIAPPKPAPRDELAQAVRGRQAPRFRDPLRSRQWALDVMGAEAAWEELTGEGAVVGIVDTGMDGTHPELAGKQLPGFDCLTGDIHRPGADSSQNEDYHATHVAGIAAAHGDNGEGIVGVAPRARILLVQIFNAELISRRNPAGYVGDAKVAQCLLKASLYGADGLPGSGDEATVLNNSWGGRGYGQTLKEAVDRLMEEGVVFVNSMGNSYEDEVLYPKGYPGVLGVGATTPKDEKVDFSTMGHQISVGAPGDDVLSSMPLWLKRPTGEPYGYMYLSGTSMAAPQVSGAIALLQERFPGASPYQLQRIVEQTADDIEKPGFDRLSGWGRLNLAALARVHTLPPDGAQVVVQVKTRNRRDTDGDGKISESDETVGVPFVDVILRQDGMNKYFAQTDAQGRARFIGVDPDIYDVWVAGGDALVYNYRAANRITATGEVHANGGETTETEIAFNTELTVSTTWSEPTDIDLLVREPRSDGAVWVGAKGGARWGTFSEDATGRGSGAQMETYTLGETHFPFEAYPLALSAENASQSALVRVTIEQNGIVESYGPFRLEPGEVLPSSQWRGWWENMPKPDEGFMRPGPGAPWVY